MFKQKIMIPLVFGLLLIPAFAFPPIFAFEFINSINNETFPAEIAINTSTDIIYVTNHDDTISIIDGKNNSMIGVIDTLPSPRGIAVNPITNMVYVANFEDNTLSVIDGSENLVVNTIKVGSSPRGVAVNPETNTIYVTSPLDNTISVIDGSQNLIKIILEVEDYPRGISVNQATNTIYITHPLDNTISVIDGSNYSLIDTISVEDGSFGITVNHLSNTVYVASCFNDVKTISIIRDSENSVTETIDVGKCSLAIGVDPDLGTIYMTHPNESFLSVYSDQISIIEAPSTAADLPLSTNNVANPNPPAPSKEAILPTEVKSPVEAISKPDSSVQIKEAILTEETPALIGSAPIEEESQAQLIEFAPYLTIIAAGIICSAIFAAKRNSRKRTKVVPTTSTPELEKHITQDKRSIKQKMKERLFGPDSDAVEDSVFDRIIQNKIRVVKTLQNSQIGDYEKLESIHNSLTVDGSFSKKDNDYLEQQYEEYKKLMHNIGN